MNAYLTWACSERNSTNADFDLDGAVAASVSCLPIALRAMAATPHLDISLTLDDIGWHSLNFGKPGVVLETKASPQELGLGDMADWFAEALAIVNRSREDVLVLRRTNFPSGFCFPRRKELKFETSFTAALFFQVPRARLQ